MDGKDVYSLTVPDSDYNCTIMAKGVKVIKTILISIDENNHITRHDIFEFRSVCDGYYHLIEHSGLNERMRGSYMGR